MCSGRSMSFWTASPLPSQPCETDLGRGLDPLTWLRSRLCQRRGWQSLSDVPPTPGPWGQPLPARGLGTLLGSWCRLLDSQIPSEMALLSVYLGLLLTSCGGNVFRSLSSKSCYVTLSAARANARGKGLFDGHRRVRLPIRARRLVTLSSCLSAWFQVFSCPFNFLPPLFFF